MAYCQSIFMVRATIQQAQKDNKFKKIRNNYVLGNIKDVL